MKPTTFLDLFAEELRESTGMEIPSSLSAEVKSSTPEKRHLHLGNLQIPLSALPSNDHSELREVAIAAVGDWEQDIRSELISHQLEKMESQLFPRVEEKFRQILIQRGVEERVVSEVSLQMADFGYFPAHHGEMEEEYTRGWPDLGLETVYSGEDERETAGVVVETWEGEPDWHYIEERLEKLADFFLDESQD